ncbi:MAG: RHS repeat-associated core domain-containing protein [Cyanothece sp. SIO1E1]|nr:RHS repeat-associated core domain-containing protein [Cyanothece sp. SIO1E1]
MPGRSSNSANPTDLYKFTGHERDDEAGLTIDYMMARNYDPMIGRFMQIDPLMEYASPYIYVGNNPLNLIDPTGMSSCSDDYYNECGQYLGSDGASTNESRVIKQSEYESIKNAHGGTTSAEATAALQNSSRTITIHEEQIGAVAQGVATSSSETGNEYSAYIVFDPENAQVFAIPGPVGDNTEVSMSYIDAGTGGPPLATDADGNALGAIVFLSGQVHGHPKTDNPGLVNKAGTSDADKRAAINSGTTVYSVDAYSRRSTGRINRVTPTGAQDNNIGRVGSFKLGLDALRSSGGKN